MDNPSPVNTIQETTKSSSFSSDTFLGRALIISTLLVSYLIVLASFFYLKSFTSPQFILLMIISFLTIHFFGLTGLIASQFGILLLLGLSVLKHGSGAEYTDVLSSTIFTSLFLIVACVVFWYFLRSRFKEHRMLTNLSQRALRERERFVALVNTIDMAVVATDSDQKISLYNSGALSLLGTNISLGGQLFSDVFPLIDPNQQPVDIISQVRSGKHAMERLDTSIKVGQKDIVNLQVIAAPIRTNFGSKGGGYVVTMRDITKQKTLDEQRNEFVSVTSHEIRTPIAIIEGTLSTALAGPMVAKAQPEVVKLIRNAHEQTLFLSRLVQDLATLAKAEGEFLEIDLKPVDPAKVIQNQFKNHTAEATEKGLNMILHPSLDLHPILSSEIYINEILENFITNAIKYTKQGTVTLGAESAAENSIRFWVADTGIGVGQADQKKLFTKFFRAEDFETRETGGTGLGLYITKKLAERIGGKVWCTSELGRGSVFYLDVPPIGALKTDAKKVTNAEIEDFAGAI